MATVLGLCFRLLADPKNSDSVVNTAAATVRQASALLLSTNHSPQALRLPDSDSCMAACTAPLQAEWGHSGSENHVCAQAVALVFEHVDVDGAARHSQLARVTAAAPAPPSSPLASSVVGGRSPLVSQGSLGSVQGSPGSASGLLAEHGPANAALKLLDNLCMMLTGGRG